MVITWTIDWEPRLEKCIYCGRENVYRSFGWTVRVLGEGEEDGGWRKYEYYKFDRYKCHSCLWEWDGAFQEWPTKVVDKKTDKW